MTTEEVELDALAAKYANMSDHDMAREDNTVVGNRFYDDVRKLASSILSASRRSGAVSTEPVMWIEKVRTGEPYVDDGDDYPVVARAERLLRLILTAPTHSQAIDRIIGATAAPSISSAIESGGAEPVAWRCERPEKADGNGKWRYYDGPPNPSHLARNVQPLYAAPTVSESVTVASGVREALEYAAMGLGRIHDAMTDTSPKQAVGEMVMHFRDRARAALSAPTASQPASEGKVVPTHRHVKRGTEYALTGFGKMQAESWNEIQDDGAHAGPSVDMREVAIYRSVDDGSLWVRPREEFEDGRFVALASHAVKDR